MSQFTPTSRWQFYCQFRKEWVNCSVEEDQKLKDAYLNCSEEAPMQAYTMNKLKMRADFSKMLRINLASERSFELKLLGGHLPFPPPGLATKKLRSRKKGILALEQENEAKIETKDRITVQPPWLDVNQNDEERFDFVPNWSGKFDFTLELEDKDDWGRVFLYKTLEAGVNLAEIDSRYLSATDKRGRSTRRNREEMQEMLGLARSYPVKVTYDPPELLNPRNWAPTERIGWELDSLLMHFIKSSITGPGAVTMDEVKYRHHQCVFQRYQLYCAEADMWNADNPMNEQEFYAKLPQMAPIIQLAMKVGPRLRDIFRGKEEILNLLFGG